MRGLELQQARAQRLTQYRRAAQNELPMNRALDAYMLLDLVTSGSAGARGRTLTRALVLRGLRALGYTPDGLAAAFTMTTAEVEQEATSPLLADPSIAGKIADRVLEEVHETYEPGRVVAPRGDFARPGESYKPDPRLASS